MRARRSPHAATAEAGGGALSGTAIAAAGNLERGAGQDETMVGIVQPSSRRRHERGGGVGVGVRVGDAVVRALDEGEREGREEGDGRGEGETQSRADARLESALPVPFAHGSGCTEPVGQK